MTTITLDNLDLSLLSSSNWRPPIDLQLVAEVITCNNVVIESRPFSTSTGNSWTLDVKSDFPADCTSLDIEIRGTSHSQQNGFQLHSVRLNTSDIVAKADDKQRSALRLDLNSVDGVLSFHLRAGFSIGSIRTGKNEADFPLDDRMIACTLRRFLSHTADRELDPNLINNLHRRIQFLPNAHPKRSLFLAGVGSMYLVRFRRSQCQDALNNAVDVFQEAMLNAPCNDTRIHIHAVQYGNALQHRIEKKGAVVDINKSIAVFEEAVRLTADGHPNKPSMLRNLGTSLSRRFERLGDLSDINKSVLVLEEAVQLSPDGHPNKSGFLTNLGTSLSHRFERLGDLNDINKSVFVKEAAIQLAPDGHPDKSSWLSSLGASLSHRFDRLGDLSDMNKSVSVKEEAVRLTADDHPDKPSMLSNLGTSLLRRFNRLGDLSDVNKSFLVLEEAIRLIADGHPDKPSMLSNLGSSLLRRFERLGDLSDMNKSVLVREEAVRLTPDGHPGKPLFLSDLGNSLACRFDRLRDLNDINKSVSVIEEAVRLTADGHPDKPSFLSDLGNSLAYRFDRLGDLNDMNKSVFVKEEAVRLTTDGHPGKPLFLSSLGNSLACCFDRLGDLNDINKSVSVIEEAVQLTPDGHPNKPLFLSNLGNSLLNRFDRLGDLSDINKSVLVKEEAVRLTPDGHPDKPLRLSHLGNSLVGRFDRLGDLSDMNKSVSVIEEAVRLAPDDHPNKSLFLTDLGNSLSHRFDRLGDLNDMNKSVSVIEEAVRLTADGHPDKPLRLSNLGISLLGRFDRLGDLSDVNKSVLVKEEAVRLTPDGHPDKPSRLSNLGNSLLVRFEHLGDLSDINESVSVIEEAVRLIVDGHPHKPSLLSNLGNSLSCRFEHLKNPSDIERVGKLFEEAAKSPTGSSSVRFRACFYWAKCCQLYHHCSVLDAYHRAFELLPNMSWLGLSITDRQHFLRGVGPLVDEAVSAAIDAGQFETAVEWMDQGHSVIWGQLLQLRSPVDDLKQRHSDVADRFTILSKKLEGAATRDNFEITAINDLPHQPVSTPSENYHGLVDERDQLLQHIRGLDGFERFLLPRTFSQLEMAAPNGPVVCINVSKCRSDALILVPGLNDILHVPLEGFTRKTAEELYGHLRRLLGRFGRNIANDVGSELRKARNDTHRNDLDAESVLERLLSQASTVRDDDRGIKFNHPSSDPETIFQRILAHLWRTVTKPILDGLAFSGEQSEDKLVRAWWFTSGFLTFLPIHAAGIYGEKAFPGSKLSDFVVSSYIPTLSSIMTDSRPTTLPNLQVLAVALPAESKLPGARQELDCIVNRVGSSNVKKLVESEATLENVIAGLEESSFVHFACHGVQDATNPNESALLLANSSRLTLSQLHRLSLPHAQLAFLSACQTAAGDETLVQESVHLAAGMLSVGYRGVIATMWSIMDSDAPVVADEVYARLFENLEPNPTQAARALDKAVKKLRKDSDGTKSFLEWVPFIHIGI